ncbi:MAG: hypothetical protein KatS3mg087_1267 [Patescibacteria group bacterium]|nr:MAG: hypothetical protein KatS3mg087_1267 [Patescibacteria group bacterium]
MDENVQSPQPVAKLDLADSLIFDNPDAKWYAVHTYSGHENRVEQTLRQRIAMHKLEHRIIDIKVPTHDAVQVKEGKKKHR